MADAAALKKALEDADGACPCRDLGAGAYGCYDDLRDCECSRRGRKDMPKCAWPGHAAIRAAMRAAAEWGRDNEPWSVADFETLAAILDERKEADNE